MWEQKLFPCHFHSIPTSASDKPGSRNQDLNFRLEVQWKQLHKFRGWHESWKILEMSTLHFIYWLFKKNCRIWSGTRWHHDDIITSAFSIWLVLKVLQVVSGQMYLKSEELVNGCVWSYGLWVWFSPVIWRWVTEKFLFWSIFRCVVVLLFFAGGQINQQGRSSRTERTTACPESSFGCLFHPETCTDWMEILVQMLESYDIVHTFLAILV